MSGKLELYRGKLVIGDPALANPSTIRLALTMAARRTARVQTPTGRRAEVGWYEGTSDAGIVQLFASALNIDTSAGIVARDPSDGSIVALNQFLPQGMLVEIDDTPNPAAASPPPSSPPPDLQT